MNPARWPRWRRTAAFAVVVLAIAVGAVIANMALLGATGEDELGRLRPVDPALTARPTTTAPARVLTTTTGARPVTAPPATTTEADDHGGDRNHGGGHDRHGDDD